MCSLIRNITVALFLSLHSFLVDIRTQCSSWPLFFFLPILFPPVINRPYRALSVPHLLYRTLGIAPLRCALLVSAPSPRHHDLLCVHLGAYFRVSRHCHATMLLVSLFVCLLVISGLPILLPFHTKHTPRTKCIAFLFVFLCLISLHTCKQQQHISQGMLL